MKLGFLSTLQSFGTLTTKIAIVAAAAIGGTALVSSSVFATLTASATGASATAVSTGTLSVTLASGSAFSGASGGFTTGITALAPTDSVVRLVTLTNAGTLNAGSMTVTVVDGTPSVLTTGSTGFAGLTATIHQCTVAYTQASAGAAYVCAPGETTVRAASSILSMATPQALGAMSASLSTGVSYLKVTISLPDFTENTLNGVIPPAGIQNKSALLTWTIATAQRAAVTTNS